MKNNLIIKLKGKELSVKGDVDAHSMMALVCCLIYDVVNFESDVNEVDFEEELDNTLDMIKETILESKEELENE